jgi:hypothetical protein
MTYSIFAADANALSPSGCAAYTYTLNGFLPYLREPWYQFSEQANDDVTTNGNTNPAFPFLTGHGGANQVVPFGFLGVRTDQPFLFINPSLPPQIPHVKIRNFYYAGAGFSASMNQTHTTITRFSTENITAITDVNSKSSIKISVGTPSENDSDAGTDTYNISIGETIYVPNRLYFNKATVEGNLLQCRSVSSTEKYADGQFPVAAIDGATATSWQPATNETASILVNMTGIPYKQIAGFQFQWAGRPPLNATVFIGNTSQVVNGITYLSGNEVVISIPVDVSSPFNAEASDAEVVPYQGNYTIAAVDNDAWTGDYVRLEITGCTEDDGKGATVSEFVLLEKNATTEA